MVLLEHSWIQAPGPRPRPQDRGPGTTPQAQDSRPGFRPRHQAPGPGPGREEQSKTRGRAVEQLSTPRTPSGGRRNQGRPWLQKEKKRYKTRKPQTALSASNSPPGLIRPGGISACRGRLGICGGLRQSAFCSPVKKLRLKLPHQALPVRRPLSGRVRLNSWVRGASEDIIVKRESFSRRSANVAL